MNSNKRFLSILCSLALVFSSFAYAPVVTAVNMATEDSEAVKISTATIEDDFADNRILVVLNEDTSKRGTVYSTANFSEIKSASVENLTAGMHDYLAPKQKTGSGESFRNVLCIELSEPGKENVLNAIKTLEGREDILYVGPDYIIRAETMPSDTYVNRQWAISNIDLDDAWDITTGSSNVMVGILDTGIFYSNNDLTDACNHNLHRDFTGDGLFDELGHGTQVAGVVGAKGNNGEEICGTCWNVKLVSLKVIGDDGLGYSSDVISAIRYATQIGIPILNLSFGWSGDDIEERYDLALNTAIDGYPGLVVCCAGNDNQNNNTSPHFPSNCSADNLIAVGASTSSNTKWANSNYGSWSVDLFAPGENIHTTFVNGVYSNSGTSLAAPFVSGIAALILTQHPSLSGARLREVIMDSVDTFSAFNGKCVTGGRVNAYKAVTSDLAHTYTVSRHNLMKHKYTCIDCGDCYYENHVWNTQGTACSICGFYPIGDL